MARGDLVPPMANTLEVISELTPEELDRCWVWVATPRTSKRPPPRAPASSSTACLRPTPTTRPTSAAPPKPALPPCPTPSQHRQVGGRIELCIATAFTCPFDGEVPLERVIASPTTRAPKAPRPRPLRHPRPGGPRRGDPPVRRRQGTRPRSAASCSTATTPGGWASPTPWRRSTPARRWSTGSRRTRRLPVRTRRQRQHLQRGPAVRHPTGLADPRRLGSIVGLTDKMLAELGEPNRSKAAQGARSKPTPSMGHRGRPH